MSTLLEDIETFRRMLRVNKHRLDEELELQSEMMDRIASITARKNSLQLEAKEDLAKVEADLFSEYKDEKVANELANAKVRANRQRITAWQRYQVARQEYEEWQGLLNAWTSRGYHLKTLADLFSAQYFSPTTITSPLGSQEAQRAALRAVVEATQNERRIVISAGRPPDQEQTTSKIRRRPLA